MKNARLNYGSNIPEARAILEGINADLHILTQGMIKARIEKALDLMTRRPAVRHTKATSQTIDLETKQRIRSIAAADPTLSNQHIATAVGVNAGRVSEVLNGLR